MTTAVVTIARGRHNHLRAQQESLARCRPRPDLWVLVSMGDPEIAAWTPPAGLRTRLVEVPCDGTELPLAAARNAGAEAALDEGADVLVFLDVDCVVAPGLVEGYERGVRGAPYDVWSGPVTYLPAGLSGDDLAQPWLLDRPHPARPAPEPGSTLVGDAPELFWSLSFALGRELWTRVGGFCTDYVGYGGEDTDFALLAAGAGARFAWTGDARAYHQHHPVSSPPVEHLAAIVRNATLFHRRWGTWPMSGWLRDFAAQGLVVWTDDELRPA